ncbi:MAG: hypothetical protein R3357_03715 [Burkholderiales bacterium]|nr:hypothetical protein [Burkholderiales bacterium]
MTSLLRLAAALAVLGVAACSPERDATSSLPLPVISHPLGVAPDASAPAEARETTQPKEDGGKRSD